MILSADVPPQSEPLSSASPNESLLIDPDPQNPSSLPEPEVSFIGVTYGNGADPTTSTSYESPPLPQLSTPSDLPEPVVSLIGVTNGNSVDPNSTSSLEPLPPSQPPNPKLLMGMVLTPTPQRS